MTRARTTGSEHQMVVTDPCGQPNPRLVVAALRAGALGVLDVGPRRPGGSGDQDGPDGALEARVLRLVPEVTRSSDRPLALRLPYRELRLAREEGPDLVELLDRYAGDQVGSIIITGPYDGLASPGSNSSGGGPRGDLTDLLGRRAVLAEAVSRAEAELVLGHGASGVIAKGCESGGRVGETEAFVLAQQIAQLGGQFWVQGGISEHTAAAAIVGGAQGVVLDGQLALVRESQLPRTTRAAIAAMDGSETRVVGGHRVYFRPDLPVAKLPVSPRYDGDTAARLGDDLHHDLVPLGQDAAAASHLARRHATVGGVVQAVRRAAADHVDTAARYRPLDPGTGLARALGTRYPVAQGPMTRVSDRPELARAVADAGALPFLALALLSGPDTRNLLAATRELLEDRPWGVGILGFVPPEVRAAQLEAVRDIQPAVALIAGGRPAQARPLEEAGIRTFLHVPSPGLLDRFLTEGARRFVFEGRECGGHVGPRASFPLWDIQVRQLLEVDDPENLEVLFAGGIHDARSAAMVASVAAPLAERGAGTGVLMGTAYLFTEEAVTTGAVTPTFQEMARGCERTVLLETSPGHATRCVESDYVRTFSDRKTELEAAEVPAGTMWADLEALNLGRLRLAAKGLTRANDRLIEVDAGTQRREGLFMIGQVATLRDERITMSELHDEVTTGATSHLERLGERASADGIGEAQPEAEAGASRAGQVAIVGMAAVFPGAADTEQYWANILSGRDCVTEVPRNRWDPNRLGDSLPSRWGGFLPWVPFDPLGYGIPPRSLASIESVQLLSLEVAARALHDAGYGDRAFDRERTSVIFGAEGGNDLAHAYGFRAAHRHYGGTLPPELDDHLPHLTEDSFPGVLTNVVAGRIANRLDLGGANYTVDAACAASLAALDAACKELATRGSDMVLCGAADVHNSVHDYLLFASVHALSPTGRCRTFDSSADGIVLGEGVACVVLKRFEDALRDGDRIYAVVDGIGSASDGRQLGLTAPREDGQTRTLRRAYERSSTSPSDVKLVEAHGTGTVVGDRTELAALTEVFGRDGTGPRSIALGSVKSQIGHTKCAAGLAGLMKAARAIHTGVLPPTLHIDAPNEFYEPGSSPFRFLDRPAPWPDRDRRAGVSAFGFGGTNFHAVLRSPGDGDRPRHGLEDWPAELVLVRATSPRQTAERLRQIGQIVERIAAEDPAGSHHRLRDLAGAVSTSGTGPVQVAIVADDIADLAAKLAAATASAGGTAAPGEGIFTRPATRSKLGEPSDPSGSSEPPKLALLHPGQGSQYPWMLGDLLVAFPRLQSVLELGPEWADVLFPGTVLRAQGSLDTAPRTDRTAQLAALDDTTVAQPVLGMAALAVTRLLDELGVRPDAAAGHSYGELAALATAGALDGATLIRLSKARARAMVEAVKTRAGDPAPGDPGAMAAVGLTARELRSRLEAAGDGLVLANHNAPHQSVVSGPTDQVVALVDRLGAEGVPARRLGVSAAFHSPLMARAADGFAADLAEAPLRSPDIPVWSGTLSRPGPTEPDDLREMLAAQLTEPVRFVEQIEDMHAAGIRVFVEAGPGRVLTQLVGRILGGRPHLAVACDARPGLRHLLLTLAELATAGVPVDVEPLFAGRARPVDLGSLPLPAPGWRVNGHLVCQADGEPVEGGLQPADRIPEVTMDRSRWSSNPSDHDTRDGVVREYLAGVRELIRAQRDVLVSYLGGGGMQSLPPPAPPTSEVSPEVTLISGESTEQVGSTHDVGGRRRPPPSYSPLHNSHLSDRTEAAGGDGDYSYKSDGTEAAGGEGRAGGKPTLEELLGIVLDVVAERTGYPSDMLEPDLDLEADLSIDSIKRIEIVGELAQRTGLPGADDPAGLDDVVVEQLASLKTMHAIAGWMVDHRAGGSRREPSAPEPGPAAEATGTAAPPPARGGAGLQRLLFETVAIPPPEPDDDLTGQTYAVISDPRDGLDQLVAELRDAGAQVEVLPVHRGAPQRTLPEDAATLLSRIDGLVHLGGIDPEAPVDARDVFASLRPAITGRCTTFLAVTARRHGSGAAATGIAGLMRSLARDLPGRTFRAVELPDHLAEETGPADGTDDPDRWKRAARLLVAEVTATPEAPDGRVPVSVAYQDGARVIRQIGKALPQSRSTPALPFDADSVVVVTGGARGITARCALALARTTGCRLELLGRTPHPPAVEDTTTAGAVDRPALRRALLAQPAFREATPAQVEATCDRILAVREIRATLAALDRIGTPATYHQVDVRDTGALVRTLGEIRERHGRIDAVVHGAGVIDDRLAADKTDTSFDRVFGTKVDPARALLAQPADDVRLVVLFGSISGVLGNRGQVDYSAANEALGDLATGFDGIGGRRVVCIHWGPWAGAGMVSPELERSYTRKGVGLIDPDDGIAAFLEEVASLPGEPPEVVVVQGSTRPASSSPGPDRPASPGSPERGAPEAQQEPPEQTPVTLAELTLPDPGESDRRRRG